MPTCPIPCLESSSTPSHLPKPCMRKNRFQNKTCCSRKHTLPNFGKSIGLPSEMNVLENLPKQFMGSSDVILLDHLPTPFSGKSSIEIPFATMFIFLSISCHALTTSFKVNPVLMKCIIPFQHIHANIFTCIYINIIKSHTTCYANSTQFTPIYQLCIYSQICTHTTCDSISVNHHPNYLT